MSESELLKRISELEVQNLALIAENERLRKEFGLPLKNIVVQESITEPVCKRLNGYAQIGYKTLSSYSQPDKISMIYDVNSFVPVIKNDFAEAKKEILIVSPFLRKKRIETVFEWLKEPIQAGISITVVTRPSESYKEPERIKECIEYLQKFAIVVQKSNFHQKFILIDNRLVWYGNINLLSYGSSEESVMRLDSRELSAELEAMV